MPPNLEVFYKESIKRFIAMVVSESNAATEAEKLKVFTDYMMDETTLRGSKYSSAVGEEGKLAKIERRGTFWGDGDYRNLYGSGAGKGGKSARVDLDEYLSSDEDDGTHGGLGVDLDLDLDFDKVKQEEVKIKPLFAEKKKEKEKAEEKPHLGATLMDKVKEMRVDDQGGFAQPLQQEREQQGYSQHQPKPEDKPNPTETAQPKPPRGVPSDATPVLLPKDTRAFTSPLSTAPKAASPYSFASPPMSPSHAPTPHTRNASLSTAPVGGYKPFKPTTPPGKAGPSSAVSPSGPATTYQAYHPAISPKVAPAKPSSVPSVEGKYQPYRPPSGVDAAKRNSWVAPGNTIPRPGSAHGTIGGGAGSAGAGSAGAGSAGAHNMPDRRMTMTAAPTGLSLISGIPKSAVLSVGEFGSPRRTHTMAWDGDIGPNPPKPGHGRGAPVGGFFALPFDGAGEIERGRERTRTPPPYPLDDGPPVAPAAQFNRPPSLGPGPQQQQPGFVRTESPAGLHRGVSPARPRSRAGSQAPPPSRSRAGSTAPYPEEAPLSGRSRAASFAAPAVAPPFPIKSLSPQPQPQGAYRRPESPTPIPLAPSGITPPLAGATATPLAAVSSGLPAALQASTGPMQKKPRTQATPPVHHSPYQPPVVPQSPPQKALSPSQAKPYQPPARVHPPPQPPVVPQSPPQKALSPSQAKPYQPPARVHPPHQPPVPQSPPQKELSPSQAKPYQPPPRAMSPATLQQQPLPPTGALYSSPAPVFPVQKQPQSQPQPQPPRALSPTPAPTSPPIQPQQPPPQQPQQQPPPQQVAPPSPLPLQPPTLPKALPAISPTIEELRAVLPTDINPLPNDKELLTPIYQTLVAHPPDFSFLATYSKEYAAEAAAIRAKFEDARRKRQEEHDEVVDKAYTAQDIGYGDVPDVDRDFKAKEVRIKKEEDKLEHEAYAEKVFGRVYERLQQDITTLAQGWAWLFDNGLKDGVAGKASWIVDPATKRRRPPLVDVLNLVLQYYRAIEMRYARINEAVVDRDRRYKKTVLATLYVAGEVQKVKAEEKFFDEKERKTVAAAAREKKARCTEMWRAVEEAIMRGLEEDIAYTEELTNVVKALLAEVPPSGEGMEIKGREWSEKAVVELDMAYRVLDEVTHRSIRFFELFFEGATESAKVEFEEKVAMKKIEKGGQLPKEDLAALEKEKKQAEGKQQEELKARRELVSGEWEGMRVPIGDALGRLKVFLASATAGGTGPIKDADEKKEEAKQPQKSVWGWFK